MTEQDFRRLKCGYYVTSTNRDGRIFKIVQEDVWGPPRLVFLAQLVFPEPSDDKSIEFIQISEANYQFWKRIYL